MYDQNLAIIEAWAGAAPVRVMETPRFVKFYEELYPVTPAKANSVMRVARLLFAHARRIGWRQDNPAEKLGLLAAGESGLVWPREAVTVFVETADALGRHSVGTAVFINEWLGQREGDVLRLPRNPLRPEGLVVWQSKTGAGVQLPIATVPHLRARIEAELANQARLFGDRVLPTRLLVDEATGRPWNEHSFRHAFAEIRAARGEEASEVHRRLHRRRRRPRRPGGLHGENGGPLVHALAPYGGDPPRRGRLHRSGDLRDHRPHARERREDPPALPGTNERPRPPSLCPAP